MFSMYLNNEEEKMYQGEYGTTVAKSMEILIALGDIYEASSLVDITSAQVSGVSYKTIGEAGLEYLEDLSKEDVNLVSIPSTLNPAGIDLDNWRSFGFPVEFSKKQKRIVEAYGKLGVSETCTCTPYLIGNVPRLGDHVAWSESSAVAYLNSVIGGRSNREGGPAALASAICGKTAMYGYHEDESRVATAIFDLDVEISGLDYGTLGYMVGKEVGDGVPYFSLKNRSKSGELKSLGASLASSGAVALYHIENETPEYELAKNDNDFKTIERVKVTNEDILTTKENLSTTNEEADLVCLGCPHASLEEIKEVAMFVKGKTIKNQLWVCTSINIKASADRMGYTRIIEGGGGHIILDTCMVVAPIEDMGYRNIGVDSAKAANYVPSICGLNVIYDNLENLIKFK
ncbi:MAG: aconitase X catalytic domain-containing protein [Methanobrevibacter sp.]|nr:aconitase X catalytic domain-containing protein [Candidatus Methanovirga aequatorialis]